MSDKYSATGLQTAVEASPGETCLAIVASTLTRGSVYDYVFSHGGTAADNVVTWVIQRFTVAGTEGAGVTPAPLDPDAPAAQLDGAEDHSVEPTYTAATELLDFDLNQRATFRWVAAPGGELVTPATAANGIGAQVFSAAYTGVANCTTMWEE